MLRYLFSGQMLNLHVAKKSAEFVDIYGAFLVAIEHFYRVYSDTTFLCDMYMKVSIRKANLPIIIRQASSLKLDQFPFTNAFCNSPALI